MKILFSSLASMLPRVQTYFIGYLFSPLVSRICGLFPARGADLAPVYELFQACFGVG